MRGKVEDLFYYALGSGITPAYAGKSDNHLQFLHRHRDHPRLCGEKSHHFGVTTDYLGSPPPMRGKEQMRIAITAPPRITPAYAGKR